MGLDCAAVKFLCTAKSMGVDFSSTLMVGRQDFFPKIRTLEQVSTILGLQFDPAALLKQSRYSEPFFTLLGAKEIASLDTSDFEGASYVHDLNLPIAENFPRKFSLVYDGGTLEHIFNLPQAFKNCMQMVRVGGHFMQLTVANNFMGHGFWQLSPELIYRIFTEDNGYRIECVLLHEVTQGGARYVVQDPKDVGHRIELCNSVPTYILTIAKRIEAKEIFAQPPQQSDYVKAWGSDQIDGSSPPALVVPQSHKLHYLRAIANVARAVKRRLYGMGRQLFLAFGRKAGGRGAPGYTRIAEDDLLRGRIFSRAAVVPHAR